MSTFSAWGAFRAEFSCFARLLIGSPAKFYQYFLRFLKLWTCCFQINVFPLWFLADMIVFIEVLLSFNTFYFQPLIPLSGGKKNPQLSLLALFPRTRNEKRGSGESWPSFGADRREMFRTGGNSSCEHRGLYIVVIGRPGVGVTYWWVH